jgi:hypothetical protein
MCLRVVAQAVRDTRERIARYGFMLCKVQKYACRPDDDGCGDRTKKVLPDRKEFLVLPLLLKNYPDR